MSSSEGEERTRCRKWTNPHLVLRPVGLDLLIVTSSDSLVLDVEVLLELDGEAEARSASVCELQEGGLNEP